MIELYPIWVKDRWCDHFFLGLGHTGLKQNKDRSSWRGIQRISPQVGRGKKNMTRSPFSLWIKKSNMRLISHLGRVQEAAISQTDRASDRAPLSLTDVRQVRGDGSTVRSLTGCVSSAALALVIHGSAVFNTDAQRAKPRPPARSALFWKHTHTQYDKPQHTPFPHSWTCLW